MVEKFEIMITPFQCMRTIHVYLPDNYNESQEQYPVMYMFDGHNLFFDEDATYGKSWGLKDFLDNYDKKLIINKKIFIKIKKTFIKRCFF